ncbi:MAG: calcium-binding protein, partial [Propionibacteriaceae bacterium]
RGTVALFLVASVAVGAPAALASAAGPRGQANRLLARDPGALVGGNTIVAINNGANIFGVPNRPNFIIGLGSGETIVGGRGPDQLGALSRNATIRGGPGDDLIHGSPRRDVIYGGPGDDLIIDTRGTPGTIDTGPGRDRVVCAPGSVDRVFADRGDSIAPACRRARRSRIVYPRSPAPAADSGQRDPNGCTNNPAVTCEYLAAAGTLPGLWSSQKTPERQCPPDHQYLLFQDYMPFGTSAPFGVEIVNIGNVGFFAPRFVRSDDYVIGARVGSVTNWAVPSSTQPWEMWLHCTSDQSQGWQH